MNSLAADIVATLWKVGGMMLLAFAGAGYLTGSIYVMYWLLLTVFEMSARDAFLIGQPLGILIVAMTGMFWLILKQKRQARLRAMGLRSHLPPS